MIKNTIQASLYATRDVFSRAAEDKQFLQVAADIVDLIVKRLAAGSKILFCGNGGSAADAQHLAGELVSRFVVERPGIAAIALTTDTSVLTAIGNDYGYERVFARQVEALGNPGDVLIAISTSGRSPNILAAIKAAKQKNLHVVGLTGRSGGLMGEVTDFLLKAPADQTPTIQEVHIAAGHIICGLVEKMIFSQ